MGAKKMGKVGGGAGTGGAAGGGGGVPRGDGRQANRQVYLPVYPRPGAVARDGGVVRSLDAGACEKLTRATRDRNDRAHDVRDGRGFLVSAREAARRRGGGAGGVTEPRRYAACHMTGRGVSHDSAADELYERQKRLEAWGIDGFGDSRASGMSGPTIAELAMAQRGGGRQNFSHIIDRNREAWAVPKITLADLGVQRAGFRAAAMAR